MVTVTAGVTSRTTLLPWSAMNTSPTESTATPKGPYSSAGSRVRCYPCNRFCRFRRRSRSCPCTRGEVRSAAGRRPSP